MRRAYPHWSVRKVTPGLVASGGHAQAFAYADLREGDWSVWELRSEVEIALHPRQASQPEALAYVLDRLGRFDDWVDVPAGVLYWSPTEPSIVYRNGEEDRGVQRWRTMREWIDAGITHRWDLSINTEAAMASLAPFQVYRPLLAHEGAPNV